MTRTTGLFTSLEQPTSHFADGEPRFDNTRTGRVDVELSDDGQTAHVTGTVLVMGLKDRQPIDETLVLAQTAKDGSLIFKNAENDTLFVDPA